MHILPYTYIHTYDFIHHNKLTIYPECITLCKTKCTICHHTTTQHAYNYTSHCKPNISLNVFNSGTAILQQVVPKIYTIVNVISHMYTHAHNNMPKCCDTSQVQKKTNGRCERFHDRELLLPTSLTMRLNPNMHILPYTYIHTYDFIHHNYDSYTIIN